MALKNQQIYYDEIKMENSLESDVDAFWMAILPEYFTREKGYMHV